MATAIQYTTSTLSKQSTDDLIQASNLLDYALFSKWSFPQRKAAAREKARQITTELRARGVL
jgi:hypothetical protein